MKHNCLSVIKQLIPTTMKKRIFLIVSSLLVSIFIFIQINTIMAANKTETQKYRVIKTEKDFEIRFYPPATLATITSTAKSYKELANPGFRKLANFIFGGNKSNKSISMTTPVHMDINDTVSSMSFVMPSAYSKSDLPEPNDPNVIISTTSEDYVAAIRFSGYASDSDIKTYSSRLQSALDARGIEYLGNFRFLGYNAPYQFWGRKNEIIVSIRWNNAK
jgi:hypothetical protein